MPDPTQKTELELILQNMRDAGESEENMNKVIEYFSVQGDKYQGADTFGEGVMQSLTSGDALKAGLQGAKGWLKGATLDIPSSIMGALETGVGLLTNPGETIGGIFSGIGDMWDTTKRAGSDPEAFGRMVGQVTGQPLTTAGLARGAVAAAPYAAPVVEGAGRIMREHQPITGMAPRWTMGRTLPKIESAVGAGIENIGQRMCPVIQGQVMPPAAPPVQPGVVAPPRGLPPYANPPQLPPGPIGARGLPPNAAPMGPPPNMAPAGPIAAPPSTAPPQPALSPASSIQLPQTAGPVSPAGLPAPTPTGPPLGPPIIPPSAPTPAPVATPPIPPNIKVVPRKVLTTNIFNEMKAQGLEIVGVTDKGDFHFAPVKPVQ